MQFTLDVFSLGSAIQDTLNSLRPLWMLAAALVVSSKVLDTGISWFLRARW